MVQLEIWKNSFNKNFKNRRCNLKKKSRYITKKNVDLLNNTSNFKCAWCGVNITEKHHIKPYSEGGVNDYTNLILLCPNCHTLHHRGEISQNQLFYRRKELSGEVSRTSGFLCIKTPCKILVGGNKFINTPNIIVHNEETLLSLREENKQLLISLKLYDKNKSLICWMKDNKWWVENQKILDFSFSKNRFEVLSNQDDRIHILIRISPSNDEIYITGLLYLDGFPLKFDSKNVQFSHPDGENKMIMKNCVVSNCTTALSYNT